MTILINPHYGTPGLVVLPAGGWRRAQAFLASWPDQPEGRLADRPDLAAAAGVGKLAVYDHASTAGPIAFAYGAKQAVMAAISRAGLASDSLAARAITLASDDLDAVQHAAAQLGCQCSASEEGAEWVSAIATPGYTEIPRDITQAYRVIPERARMQWSGSLPTHIVVPGGAGLLAAAVSVHLRPWAARLIVLEPAETAPLMTHAMGQPGHAPGLLVWQELERAAFAYVAGPLAIHGAALGFGPDSRVLVFKETAAELRCGNGLW